MRDEKMSDDVERKPVGSVMSNIVSGVLVLAAGVYISFEAQKFEGAGATMPLFVGYGLIVLSILLIAAALLKPVLLGAPKKTKGDFKPRLILAGIMTVWVILLPITGFLLTSIVAFALISMAVPKSARWSVQTAIIHVVGGIVVTFLFWYCMTRFLHVPLPSGIFQ